MTGNKQIHKMDEIPRPNAVCETFSFQQIFRYMQQTEKQMLQNWTSKRFFLIAVLVTSCFVLNTPARAFEVDTHRQLTDKAIESIEAQLHTYLVDNLGLEGGLNEQLGIFNARGWMIEGSNFEDDDTRPRNHFHDPISDVGLTGLSESAIDWSLRSIGGQGEDAYSWNDAREYYFKALTSPTKTERDENWGKTFRALGQVIHLLQDQASPAHVRNDPHLSIGGLGDVDGLHDFMAKRDVVTYTGLGIISPNSSILEEAGVTRAEPFSNLFDNNQYTGPNPDASLGGQAGLAEYANANFFSDDRIAGQPPFPPLSVNNIFWRPYPHPNLSELVPAPVPSPYLTLARLGSAAFSGARTAKLTGNQAVATFLLTNTNLDLLGQLQLDDAVYDAQAQNLIPRAVGYSAAVLDYFFRPQYTLEPSTQEPYHHEFELTGTFTPGSPDCGLPIDPTQFEGHLNVRIPIPSDLNFSDGTAFIYYEKSDGSRVLGEQFDFPRSFPPFGQWLSFGVAIPHADVPDSVRWYVVLEGMAGPGDQENRAILANTDKAARMYYCLG